MTVRDNHTFGGFFRQTLETYVLFPLFGLLLLGVIWGTTIYLIHVEGEAAIRVANESSLKLLDIYEAQVVGNLQTIDQTLRTVRYAYERRGAKRAFTDLLEQGLIPSAMVFVVSIADRNGDIVISSRSDAMRNIADQPYFRVHATTTVDRPFVSVGVGGYVTGDENLHFSRRLSSADGTFAGIVVASIWPGYFTSEYEQSRLGQKGLLALVGPDGSFLARRTGGELSWGDDGNYVPATFGAYLNSMAGEPVINPWDRELRYTQMRYIYQFPVAVFVGLSEEEQLADFRKSELTYLWGAVAASMLLTLIVGMLSRYSWQLDNSRRRTRKDQETYYAASNASLDAFFALRTVRNTDGDIIDFSVEDTNDRGAMLFDRTRDAVLGKSFCEVFPRSRDHDLFEILVHVAETGEVHEQEWENRFPRLRAKWLYRQLLQVEDGLVAIVRDITERKQAELLRIGQGRVLEMIASGVPLGEVLENLANLTVSQLQDTMSSVLLLEPDGLHLRHGAAAGLPQEFVRAIDGVRISEHAGSCGPAVYRRETVIAADIEQDPLWDDYRNLATSHGLRSCWSAPIISRQDKVLGTFSLYSREARQAGQAEKQLIEMAVHIAGIAIDRQHTEDRIRHMAHHDALTGLPNRTLLEDRIEQAVLYAKRYDRQVTVAFVDLDNFKLINDSLGHGAGDQLLQSVAERIVKSIRSTDTVVRLGGDEFVIVLCDQPADAGAVTSTINKIVETIGAPLHIGTQQLRVTCSIGLAIYPGDGADSAALLKNADAAMYRAKELGRNNYQFFKGEMKTEAECKLSLQEDLRRALTCDEFFLLYQPQVDLRSGRIFGVEALIRWQHPQQGIVGPAEFIAAAEQSGAIVGIGEWVLRTACRQNKAWQDSGLPPIVMSVNVSARQFKDDHLVAKVARALEESGLEPRYLGLELTESLIMQDLQQAIATMRELRAMGVSLSVDDFGTGYSSLSALKSFPIVRLKLDRSFVCDLPQREDDKAIARAVISLGHKLNLRVVAEGVETAEQLAFLRDNGCDEMQGYYFSKPVLAADIAELFKRQGWADDGR